MTGRNFFGAAPLQAGGVTRTGAAEAEPRTDTPAPGADTPLTAKEEAKEALGLRLQQARASGHKYTCMYEFHNKFGKLDIVGIAPIAAENQQVAGRLQHYLKNWEILTKDQ